MTGPATAMVCYKYAFKVSPTLKNICSYLYEKEGTAVDVIVEDIRSDEPLVWPGVRIIDTGAPPRSKFLTQLLRLDRARRYPRFLRKNRRRYARVFAVDFEALEMLNEAGYDLGTVIFLSLEGTDYMQHRDKTRVAQLLSRCALRVVQGCERADDINRYLSSSLAFEYLPVSCRFQALNRPPARGNLRLIYTGYFADWACLTELLTAYRESSTFEIASLLLQGHCFGTEKYLEQVREQAEMIPATAVDTSYYSEAAHAELLAQYDVGLAFYRNIGGTSNFDNLILSSGKIATYLWSGLPVLTNIRSEYSGRPPFLFVDLADPGSLRKALERIEKERDFFREAAYEMAQSVYSFDPYMAKVCEKMPPLPAPVT